MRRQPAAVGLALTIVVLSLLATGCGGGSSPGVASVASSTTAASPTPQSGTGVGASAQGGTPGMQGGGQAGFIVNVGNGVQGAKLSTCIRQHGEPTFPDPNGQGLITVVGIDRHSPQFESALSACQKLLPRGFGHGPTPAQKAQQRQGALALARCMRAHGIKDFPDPTGGGPQVNAGPGSDLNPNNPFFQRAESACRSLLPPSGKGIP